MAESVSARRGALLKASDWNFEWRTIGRLLGVWALCVIVALVLRRGLSLPTPNRPLAVMLVESSVLLCYFIALLSYGPARAWLRAIPSPHRTVLAVFFFALATGQLTLDSRRTFPFPAWTMYGRKEAPQTLEYYRYHGVDRLGRRVEVDPAKLFQFVNVAEIDSRVKGFGRQASLPPGNPKREVARAQVRDWLGALAAVYNLRHPDAPLRSLEFIRYNWEFRRFPASQVPPESLVRIELPEPAAR
ncbi:MAG TPA: hypothetical protein VH763_09025 [Gemmatimonadales bacterium]|jgi:hypothetical protein